MRRHKCLECRESPTGHCRRHRPPEDPSIYPAEAGRRIDQYVPVPGVGVPLDMGWAIGVLNADETFTRTCKGCGITVTSPINASGDVAPLPINHKDDCPVFNRLGNNPILS